MCDAATGPDPAPGPGHSPDPDTDPDADAGVHGQAPAGGAAGGTGGAQTAGADQDAEFSALLEDNVEDLYEHAPCGYLSTMLDGRIAKINTTLLIWLGYTREQLVGRRRFTDLLSIGGKLYHETHFAPLLRIQGHLGGIALELVRADGSRLPVLITATLTTSSDGHPLLIRTTVFDASDRRAYEQELLRARREAEQAQRDAEQQYQRVQRLATTLQRSLLPPSLPAVPGLQVAGHYHPASTDEVGGDFYDLFPISTDNWAFFLGDVCGKDATAAAVTSLTRYTLRSATVYDPDPVAVLTNLNQVLLHDHSPAQHTDEPRFCTVIFGLATPTATGYALTLASGGHPPALLIRADGTVAFLHTPGGQIVGLLEAPHIATTTVDLAPGDTLLLYTDGLTEARTGTPNARYDEDALAEFAATLGSISADRLIEAITALLAEFGTGLEDDVAALAFSVPAQSPKPQ